MDIGVTIALTAFGVMAAVAAFAGVIAAFTTSSEIFKTNEED